MIRVQQVSHILEIIADGRQKLVVIQGEVVEGAVPELVVVLK
jgi:hypothetical protein